MKRSILLALAVSCLLLCFAVMAFASGPQVLATGSVTRANMKLSLVNGTAFFDFGTDLTAFVGEKIEIYDSSKNKIEGFISTVGTGETLGDELLTDASYDAVTKATAKTVVSISKANPGVVTLAAGHGYANGDVVYFSGLTEMTELNGQYWQLRANSGDTFQLATVWNTTSLDTSGYGLAEATGGACVQKVSFTSWTTGYATWVPGVDGAGALTGKAHSTVSGANQCLYQSITTTAGFLTKLVTTSDAVTGGTYRGYVSGNYLQFTSVNTVGAVSWYGTADAATRNYGLCATADLVGTFTAISLKQVTAPSTTGHWIVSTVGGSTKNFASKSTSFSESDGSGYTYRILSTNIPGKLIASGALTSSNVRLATVDGGAMVHLTDVDLSGYAGSDAFTVPSTNLQLHLKADAGCFTDAGKSTACANDGDKVYTWADQSGNGNDAVQATEGNRPLYKTNIVGTLPAIRFDGSDDGLLIGAAVAGTTSTSYIVYKNDTTNDVAVLLHIGDDSGTYNGYGYGMNSPNRNPYAHCVANVPDGPQTTNMEVATLSYTPGLFALKVNGMVRSLTTPTRTAIAPTNYTYVGKLGSTSGFVYDGDIYEILVYSSAHDDLTRTQIERYLAGKWGISYTPTVYGTSPAKYLLCLYDSSSRVACGYVGAVGGGESLGDELWTGSFSNGSAWMYDTFTVSGSDITQAVKNSVYACCYQQVTTTTNALYKIVFTKTIASGATGTFLLGNSTSFSSGYALNLGNASNGLNTYYFNQPASGRYWGFMDYNNTDWSMTGASAKQVTDVAATGVHLHSTPNATDRKMAIKASGFDPNAVTSYKIYRVY